MTYSQFKSKWLGKSVDFDKYYGKQCVDLVYQYINEMTGVTPRGWGNAIQWATNPNPQLLALYKSVSDLQAGDIVVLKPIDSAKAHANGHIGIYDSGNVAILEQNGSNGNGDGKGGNAIRVRTVPRGRVVAVYRRKTAPAPIPTPNPTPQHPFASINGRTIKVTERFSVYKQGTDIKVGYVQSYNYIVRGMSSRTNRVVINSASNGGLVDIPLADRTGKYYSGWQVI